MSNIEPCDPEIIHLSFRHSEELIKRLEQAGLGYHVDADKTTDRLGNFMVLRKIF